MTDTHVVLDRVASLAAVIERRGVAVEDVTCDLETTDGAAAVELSLSVPVEDATTETGDETAATGPETDGTTTADRGDPVQCDVEGCTESFDSERGMKIHRTKRHGGDGGEADADGETDGTEPGTDTGDATATDADNDTAEGTASGDGTGTDRSTDGAADGDSDDRPVYRDPDALAAAYATTETFPEMRDELGVDVTPATVRRYAVEHGIHDPEGNDDSSSADGDENPAAGAEQHHEGTGEADEQQGEDHGGSDEGRKADTDQVRATDGGATARNDDSDVDVGAVHDVGDADEHDADGRTTGTLSLPDDLALPDHVAPEEFVAAVEDASTVYEVSRDLRVDRGTAKRLLRECDLLETLRGRRAEKGERDDEKAELLSRLKGGS